MIAVSIADSPIEWASSAAVTAVQRVRKFLDDVGDQSRSVWYRNGSLHRPCEGVFEEMAREDPARLISMLADDRLMPTDLTFAAEIAGGIADSALVRPALLRLLGHPSPFVREGAIYGISRHMTEEVVQRLRELASIDPSPGVRAAAEDVVAGQ